MKIIFVIWFSFLVQTSFSQNIIIVQSIEDKEVLPEVLFYSDGELIGKTDENGKVILQLNKINTIQVVKEGYEDLTIARGGLTSMIFLKKLELIILNEVVVSKLSVNQILNKVEEKLVNHTGFYDNAKTFQYFNILTVGKDTLHYLNNRMKFIPNNGNYINLKRKIVKNFYFDNYKLIYKLGNKRVTFIEGLNTYWPFIGSKDEFLAVMKSESDYDFDLTTTEDYYKIVFKAIKNKKFSYAGYVLVDKLDFGIYELEMKLVPNSKNIQNTYLFTEEQNTSYLINESNLFYSMTKIGNEYVVNWASHYFTATHTKGDFKGEKFVNRASVESTPDFIDDEMYKFNLLTYEKF